MTAWRIRALPEPRLAEAWPLVRLRYGDWTLDKWLAEARTLLADEDGAGVLTAENESGYIYAVCGYQVDRGDHGDAELALRVVANVGWRGAADPLRPLLVAVDTVARDHECTSARIDGASVAAAGETARWEALGYRWIGLDLRKPLIPTVLEQEPQYRSLP